ncbi:antifreeze protein [Telmatospirillum siberiense]|uniref:Antifreeze protein n=1 Tax=Telmatospirillum siberiense TaxID=382514 RepID=A0A2N3PQV6_9PROT|nr:antifreeze protein [Telmatospirillum siberiense]PKU22776.1 antifreeze protein [Telmatospirillum siberiense]
MSASSVEPKATRASCRVTPWRLAVLLALSPLAALAQDGPTPLTPSAAPQFAPPQSTPATPAQSILPPPSAVIVSPSAGSPTPEGVLPRGERIQVQDLGVLDANATGVIDEGHGGFGSDMWAGSSMNIVQKVLPLMPGATPWRSLRALERKLLLTTAAVPAGKPVGDSLIKLRADRLWAMGDVDGLNALLKGVPDPAFTPALRRLQVDAALVAGDSAGACQQAAALRSQAASDAYPAKLQVYCQFSTGKGNEAGLGVDLLREQKVNDPAFFAAADALAGIAPGKMDGFANPTPLTLAMARAAKLPLPESVASATSSPSLLRAIATMDSATTEARLAAAEKAESLGSIDTELLRQLYEQVTFTTQELSAPVNAAGTDKGVRSRALLFRAAVQQTLPTAKVEIIAKALGLAGDGPAYFTAARLYAPQITALRPTPELASFAVVAARALYAAQRSDAAAPWVALARGGDPSVAGAAAGLWPLTRMAGAGTPQTIPSATLAAWRKARGELPPAVALRRQLTCFGLLTALGDKIAADEWQTLYDEPQPTAAPAQPPATALRGVLWQGLRVASDELRQGETVMFSLATLGEVGLNQADPTDLYRIVAALRLIGLDADARALAVEAAIANGL